MDPTGGQTGHLEELLDRLRCGAPGAAEELLACSFRRLKQLVHKMLRHFPNVARREDPEDVLQGSALRLMKSLRQIVPNSVREFYGLACLHIRWELLDLARAQRCRHVTVRADAGHSEAGAAAVEPADEPVDHAEIGRWAEFHRAVERLPAEQREVVSLVFYHGWTQPRIAELFQVSERTVRRWWRAGCEKLSAEFVGRHG